jgi:WD40 repeat protein
VITSAAYDQKALDVIQGHPTGARGLVNTEDGRAHSPFAQALFQGIAGAADLKGPNQGNGIITATELYFYIRDQVEPQSIEEGQREGQQLRQTPGFFTLGNHDKGEYIFLDPHNRLNLPPIPDRSPYKGLASFDEADQSLFYGRERVIADLRSKYADRRLLVITGASGTGKSSVIKAGLLPVLRAAGCRILPVLRPGEHPLAALEQANAAAQMPASAPEAEPATAPAPAPAGKCILIIDQYEELITRCGDEAERQAVAARLRKLLDEDEGFQQVILTVRSDFEPLLNGGALKDYWTAGRCTVPPFSLDELREVVRMPTTQEVLIFDPPQLVDDIVAEVVQAPGALPLLSYALSELYEAYRTSGRQDRALKREDYDRLGGVIGALHTKADAVYAGLEAGEQGTMRKIMLRMVSVEGDLAGKRVHMEDLHFSDAEAPVVAKVVDALVDARLIVRHEDSIEPAHDALVRAWKALRDWIFEVGKDKLILGAKLSEAAAEFSKNGNADFLWNANPNLPVVQSELGKTSHLFNAREVDFIDRSVRRKKRRKLIARASAAVIFVALSAATWIAEKDKTEAEKEQVAAKKAALQAEVRSLEFASQSQPAVNHDLALLLALEAARLEPLPEIQKLIDEELDVPGQLLAKLVDPEMKDPAPDMMDVAWEPTGEHIATVSADANDDNFVRLWDAKSHSLTGRCVAKGAYYVVWSPHGRFFAVGGHGPDWINVVDSKSLTIGSDACHGALFQAEADGEKLKENEFERAAWSPDGRCLVAMTDIGTLSVLKSTDEWHTKSEKALDISDKGFWMNANWDSAGKRLIAVSFEGTRLWDVPACGSTVGDGAGRIQSRLIYDGVSALEAAWSPQGDRVLVRLNDKTVSIRDAASGRELNRLVGHQDELKGAAWDLDGRRIVTASDDGSAKIWNASTGALIWNLSGHSDAVTHVGWSADGKVVFTAGDDHTVRTWDAGRGKQQAVMMHQGHVNSVGRGPDRLLVTASSDGFARVWDPDMPAWPPRVEFGLKQFITSIYSPDQSQILSTGSQDGRAIIWDAQSGKILFELHAPEQAVAHARGAIGGGWNQRGNRIVTAGDDGMVRIWDAATYRLAFEFLATNQSGSVTPLWNPHGDPPEESGDRLMTWGPYDQVKIWRIGDAGIIGRPTVLTVLEGLGDASWSPDGKRVLVTREERPYATLWDLENGDHQDLQDLPEIEGEMLWSPDGKWFAIGTKEGQVILYPSGGGGRPKVLFHPPDGRKSVAVMAWNHRSTQFATISEDDNVLRIWNIDGGQPREYRGFGARIYGVAWSPDDALIVGHGADATAMVWDVASAERLTELIGHTDAIDSVTWDRTGTQVLTSGMDGVARVNFLGWKPRLDAACERVSRNLSKAEWKNYFGNDDWHETCPGKTNP